MRSLFNFMDKTSGGIGKDIPGIGMGEKIFRGTVRAGYVFGFCLMIASLPHSKFMMSLSQFILAGAFVLERYDLHKLHAFWIRYPGIRRIILIVPMLIYLLSMSIIGKFRLFFKNIPAVIFSSIFLLHIAGLIFTTDFDYAFKDLRTKLPLLLLPLFISTTHAFGKKYFNWLMLLFVASVLSRTMINSYNLVLENFIDIRDISKSISHIIVSLLISLSIFILGNFIIRKRIFPLWLKAIFGLVIAWFVVYMIISKSGTGLVITGLTLMILLLILLFTVRNEWMKMGFVGFLILGIISVSVYLSNVYKDYHYVKKVDFKTLKLYTSKGNPYVHDTLLDITENGNYVYLYVQDKEMREAWNKRSRIQFDSLDRKKQLLSSTLTRFLTSKGLYKDASGVNSLTADEVQAVENGTANVIFTKSFSLRGLIYELLWGYDEYESTGNPTGSSLMQRLEFWKASRGIIRTNWLTGVGTGDMNEAFQKEYEKMKTMLPPGQRWRSHDQFLSIFIGFGFIGFVWFLFAIVYPPFVLGKFRDYFFLIFFIIAMIAMIPEDTIETQAGVTFFAFFYSFFLFGRKEEESV